MSFLQNLCSFANVFLFSLLIYPMWDPISKGVTETFLVYICCEMLIFLIFQIVCNMYSCLQSFLFLVYYYDVWLECWNIRWDGPPILSLMSWVTSSNSCPFLKFFKLVLIFPVNWSSWHFGTSGRRCSRSPFGGQLATTLMDRYFGTSGRRCSRSPLGGRLATTLVDRNFHHYFLSIFFPVATFSHRRSFTYMAKCLQHRVFPGGHPSKY